jgi:predicted nucleotidyltransferase component of viral defense system
MGKAILAGDQKRTLGLFGKSESLRNLFYLTGGTALAAFYLEHRYSDDLDFFTSVSDFPQLLVEKFVADVKKEIGADDIAYRRLYDRRIFFLKKKEEELKMEFTLYPFPQLHEPEPRDGVPVDSLLDIAANKLMALVDRIEAKDFVDLYFIVKEKGITFVELCELVKKKFQFTIDPVALGSEFAKVRTLKYLPRMVKSLTLLDLKQFYGDEAKRLTENIFKR